MFKVVIENLRPEWVPAAKQMLLDAGLAQNADYISDYVAGDFMSEASLSSVSFLSELKKLHQQLPLGVRVSVVMPSDCSVG